MAYNNNTSQKAIRACKARIFLISLKGNSWDTMFLGCQQTLNGAFPEASLRERERERSYHGSFFQFNSGLRSRACAPVHAANNLGHSMKNTLRCYCWLVGNSSGLAFCLSVDHQPGGTTFWRLYLLYWGCVLLVDTGRLSQSLSVWFFETESLAELKAH